MQTVREIMAKYDELEDKTLISDDYKAESPKFGKQFLFKQLSYFIENVSK